MMPVPNQLLDVLKRLLPLYLQLGTPLLRLYLDDKQDLEQAIDWTVKDAHSGIGLDAAN